VRFQETEDGGASITVRIKPPRWVTFFTARDEVERTFALDRLGYEVYQACDGKSDVRTIVRRFAKAHKLSIAEAEASVTMFLKTVVSKGLVAVAVERTEGRKRG